MKLGQGDNLKWKKIRAILQYIFRKTKINVFICVKIEHTEKERFIILELFHGSILKGQLEINKTIKTIQKQFKLMGMKNYLKTYV